MINKIIEFAELIKIEHSIFALPYVLVAAVIASNGVPNWWRLLWIFLAFIGARSFAMAFNRIVDKKIDGLNPRTKNRALPAGRLKVMEAIFLMIASLALLILSTLLLPRLCLYLLPVALIFLSVYSYIKYFTYLSHFILGMCLGMGAAGGWIAMTGTIEYGTILIGAAVTLWVASFDIIYACQDFEFDKQYGLHSIPQRFGLNKALIISSVLHVITIILFIYLGIMYKLQIFYWIGIFCITLVLFYEHKIVLPDDLSKVNQAFFSLNGYVSIIMFCFTFFDYLI